MARQLRGSERYLRVTRPTRRAAEPVGEPTSNMRLADPEHAACRPRICGRATSHVRPANSNGSVWVRSWGGSAFSGSPEGTLGFASREETSRFRRRRGSRRHAATPPTGYKARRYFDTSENCRPERGARHPKPVCHWLGPGGLPMPRPRPFCGLRRTRCARITASPTQTAGQSESFSEVGPRPGTPVGAKKRALPGPQGLRRDFNARPRPRIPHTDPGCFPRKPCVTSFVVVQVMGA